MCTVQYILLHFAQLSLSHSPAAVLHLPPSSFLSSPVSLSLFFVSLSLSSLPPSLLPPAPAVCRLSSVCLNQSPSTDNLVIDMNLN